MMETNKILNAAQGEQLSQGERDTLNEAMAIILRHTPLRASWVMTPSNYHGHPSCSVSYFDSSEYKTQHSGLWSPECSFADKIQKAIDIEAGLEATKETRKNDRILKLQEELLALTDEQL